ncbi:MAG TPA: Ig domain-containing protein [Gaiellaceae bacterium]|nr:Ig domain-containing protein [Gaiellaceae bacterium]
MRLNRLAAVLAVVLGPLLLAPGASALDLETDFQPPPGEVGTPYEWEFEAEEGCVPYRFSYLNGTVPPGLRITQDGLLTGTPTLAGRFEFWVALDDNSGPHNPACQYPSIQSQGQYFMTVLPDLAVTTSSLPAALVGTPYRVQLEFSNPEAGWPVTWDIVSGSLPAGLTLSENGVLSGTPTGADSKTFVVRAREPFRRFGERELTLHAVTALQAGAALSAGEVGIRFRGGFRAAGGLAPVTWSLASGALPVGLALDPATGALAGRPRAAGTFPLTVVAADAAGQRVTVTATVRIAARLAVRTSRLRGAEAGETYSARLATTGGVGAKRWRVVRGQLPDGLRLDAATGRLRGTPTESGTFRFTVEVRDRLGARATRPLVLTVRS